MTSTTRPPTVGPAPPPAPLRPLHRRRRIGNLTAAAVFLTPALVLIVVLRLVPVIQAVTDATHTSLPGSTLPPSWAGAGNFSALWHSHTFWTSVQQTLLFNVIVNPLQIVIALALAVLLTRNLPGTGLWRTLIFLPAAVPMTGSAVVWGIALRPDGPVNAALGSVGVGQQPFLNGPNQVVGSLILIASWIGVGYWMIFLIAGLNDIPQVYYEAAEMDGAGPLRRFWSVTLPMLRRPLLFVLVADTVSNFVLFAPMQILTDGGPQQKSNFLMYDIFHNSFDLADPHTAAAELLVLLVMMIVIVAVQFRLLRSTEGE
ncbi:sugar ABC transporter permease [Actinacidiphila oryziradicis]|jgi:multiple sugar transport system permease protein|uniref:carbohydrate ABC transporter permease n=1 Tax=Actinacidiphila oryziradicis TaxID=2571141 RepID=UPI0023F4A973|nr:sugar ABC transporter permease [Actinacidiphila oryziradicis]MCW2869706.1 transporter permease [Actinacidiphila oryziradicis]